MLTISEQEQISYWFYEKFREIESESLKVVAEHLGKIQKMPVEELSKLEQIAVMNGNIHDINNKLADLTGKMPSEIEKKLTEVAQAQYGYSSKFYKANGIEQVSMSDNIAVMKLLSSVSSRVSDDLKNLSHTTVFAQQYKDSIDKAILSVTSGADDIQSVIRSVIRENAKNGFRTNSDGSKTSVVKYISGNTRRLDTAVRLNVLEGMHMVNQGVALITGEEFGADGVEITSHANPAPDHIHIDGICMTMKAYESFQKSAQRPIGELNCYHFAFPIVISTMKKKVYDEKGMIERETQRISMVNNLEKVAYMDSDGEKIYKTMYEWSQEQRKLETLMRYQNDIINGASAVDDLRLHKKATLQRAIYEKQYVEMSNQVGLSLELRRAT